MIVVSILPRAEFGPNDHREDAPHFTQSKKLTFFWIFLSVSTFSSVSAPFSVGLNLFTSSKVKIRSMNLSKKCVGLPGDTTFTETAKRNDNNHDGTNYHSRNMPNPKPIEDFGFKKTSILMFTFIRFIFRFTHKTVIQH